jgi:hypothetical protein
MMSINESKVDQIFGLLLGIFALLLFFVIIPNEVADTSKFGVSPRFLPNVLALLLLVLSICQIVSGFKKKDKKDQKTYTINPNELKLIGKSMLIFIVYLVAINIVGYLISTTVTLAVFMLVYGQKNIKKIALVSVGIPIVIYIFFTKALQMVLP